MTSGWIGVGLDGVLAFYDGWKGPAHIGEPIQPMIERVKGWLEDGITVKIFTARVTENEAWRETQIMLIQDWCEKHLGERLEVTCVKDSACIEIWDDRCVQMIHNTGQPKCAD
jgi:hypothetical protein